MSRYRLQFVSEKLNEQVKLYVPHSLTFVMRQFKDSVRKQLNTVVVVVKFEIRVYVGKTLAIEAYLSSPSFLQFL